MKDHPKIIFYLFLFLSLPLFFPPVLLGEWRWRSWVEGAGCVLEEGQRLNFGSGDSEMFKSVCVSVCHIDIWTSMSAVLAGV